MTIGWISITAVAIALAMDAFAVAIVTGLTLDALTARRIFRLSFHFGLFQAMMPVIGWIAGTTLQEYIAGVDHWVAFGLLAFVGTRMIVGAVREVQYERRADPTKGWHMVALSVATSIDALAVGLSFAVLGQPIAGPAAVIGVITAGLTAVGMGLGRRIGLRWGPRVEAVGGGVLIVIGARILAAHLF